MGLEKLEALKSNISQYAAINNISIRELGRRTGLTDATLLNIIHGRSKNPGIESIHALATELSCSVEELLNEPGSMPKTSNNEYDNQALLGETIWEMELFNNCVLSVNKYIHDNKIVKPALYIIQCICEIYSYCASNIKNIEPNSFDDKFAQYICEKMFST
jgi:transcriptional regulator with XRE-family HTH domain